MENIKSLIYGEHLVSIDDLDKRKILQILDLAVQVEEKLATNKKLDVLDGFILATLFFEPSTRTRLSFETAMLRMGGAVVSTPDGKASSSAVKGETIADTIRTVSGYADVIVQRHPHVGSAIEAAKYASIPVINAGDGSGEHPTQALLDLYTLQKECGSIDGLRILLVGDLKNGRTTHSLLRALCYFDVEITLVSPPELRMPEEIVQELRLEGADITETIDMEEASRNADAIYMTRVQKERFATKEEYEHFKGLYVIDEDFVRTHAGTIIMHPLPRVDEITPEVDDYEEAAYFRQAANGVFIRAVILALILKKEVVF